MASLSTRSKTRTSDHDTTSHQKRKSVSNHNSPTAPNTSTLKKSPSQATSIKTKTQSLITSTTAPKEQSTLTPSYGNLGTKPTGMSKEIKKEKMDEVVHL